MTDPDRERLRAAISPVARGKRWRGSRCYAELAMGMYATDWAIEFVSWIDAFDEVTEFTGEQA
ncbi:MAG: hypothetical protein J2P48_19025 [Alphaproteobacteria bacterium]|nr:hypothetical protein [Alphaproteobacteria bacterium]